MSADTRPPSERAEPGVNPRAHLHRVFSLVALALVGGFVLQRLLRPASFGDLGPYRADSLQEIASRQPIHQGRDVCASCHLEIHRVHQKDVHWSVQCEDCHGPGHRHVAYLRDGHSAITAEQARMPKEYTLEGCLFCHRKLAARPSDFAQIDPGEHYEFLHVTEPATPCIACHNPHEPLFLLEPVSEARVHPIIFECDDCHAEPPAASHKEVPDHPTIFVCADCHPSVARDFEKRQHAFLRCTGCHLFHPENAVAGRVYQNGNRKFCLLCHERKPFKDPDRVAQIDPTAHVEEMAPVMRLSAASLLEDPTSCLQCHFDYIHDPDLIRRLQEQER
jgi:hypothetical protein